MKISIDISYYPLTEDYIGPIKSFIKKLKNHPGLEVETNSMSTQIRGEHDIIFALLAEEIPAVLDERRAAFVLKIIKGNDKGQ